MDAPRMQTVAIFELRAVGAPQGVANALLDIVSQEVARAPGLKVLSRKEMEAILSEEARKQLAGCDSNSCLSELAGALNAELLVTGELSRLGQGHLLTLQLINHRYANVMNRVSLTWSGPVDKLPDVAVAASQLLAVPREDRVAGSLTVEAAPLDVRMFIDEKPVRPLTFRLKDLEVGVHSLRLTGNGYEEREVPFVVKSGQAVRLNGALRGIALYRRPWFVGGAFVAIGIVSLLGAVVFAGIPLTVLTFAQGGASVSSRGTPPGLGGR